MFRIAMVGGVALAAAGFVLSAAPAVGDGSGTVNASVTGSAACVTVNPGSVEFGTANFSRGAGPFGGPFDSNIAGTPLTIVNCSQQDEDVFVSGTDATDDSHRTAARQPTPGSGLPGDTPGPASSSRVLPPARGRRVHRTRRALR